MERERQKRRKESMILRNRRMWKVKRKIKKKVLSNREKGNRNVNIRK